MKIKVSFKKGTVEGVGCELFTSSIWSFKLTDNGETKTVGMTTCPRAAQRLEKALNAGLAKTQSLEVVEKHTLTDLG